VLVRVTAVLALFCFAIAAYEIYDNEMQKRAAEVEKPTAATMPPSASATEQPFVSPIDFEALCKGVPDAIAWLTIDGTKIDYPVVQTDDNQFYVHNSAEKKASKYGAVFLDFRNHGDFSDFYNIIYAHNMANGSMFGTLVRFKQKDFFDRVQTGTLNTPTHDYELQIFACSVTNSTSDYYQSIAFLSPAEKESHLAYLKKTAKYWRDITIGNDDRIVILSTCSYEFDEARTVVLAKLVETA
jgi:sortase B